MSSTARKASFSSPTMATACSFKIGSSLCTSKLDCKSRAISAVLNGVCTEEICGKISRTMKSSPSLNRCLPPAKSQSSPVMPVSCRRKLLNRLGRAMVRSGTTAASRTNSAGVASAKPVTASVRSLRTIVKPRNPSSLSTSPYGLTQVLTLTP